MKRFKEKLKMAVQFRISQIRNTVKKGSVAYWRAIVNAIIAIFKLHRFVVAKKLNQRSKVQK